jgi:hypothetical protein
VYPIFVRDITFSADESIIERAREVARRENKTLEAAFYDWLVLYASRNVTEAEVLALFDSPKHVEAGRKFTRDEMNER